jgi:hypothetical protein
MSDKLKQYFWSSFVTFISSFLMTAIAILQAAPANEAVSWSFAVSLTYTAGRAAVKALTQYLMSGDVEELLGAKGRV